MRDVILKPVGSNPEVSNNVMFGKVLKSSVGTNEKFVLAWKTTLSTPSGVKPANCVPTMFIASFGDDILNIVLMVQKVGLGTYAQGKSALKKLRSKHV